MKTTHFILLSDKSGNPYKIRQIYISADRLLAYCSKLSLPRCNYMTREILSTQGRSAINLTRYF